MTDHHTDRSEAQGSSAERRFPTMPGNCHRRCTCFGRVGYGSRPHPASFPPVTGRWPVARAGRPRSALSVANRHCPAARSANHPQSQPDVPTRAPVHDAPHYAGPSASCRNPASRSCMGASASPLQVVKRGANDTFPQFISCVTTKRAAVFPCPGVQDHGGNANRPIRVLLPKAVARHCVLGQRICEV